MAGGVGVTLESWKLLQIVDERGRMAPFVYNRSSSKNGSNNMNYVSSEYNSFMENYCRCIGGCKRTFAV